MTENEPMHALAVPTPQGPSWSDPISAPALRAASRAALTQAAGGAAVLPAEALALLADGPPMYVAGLDGLLTYANRAYCALLEQRARMSGVDVDWAGHFALDEIVYAVSADGAVVMREDVVETDAGTDFYSSQHFPILDADGAIVAVGGIYQNATREAQAWLETLAARERFQDISRLVSDWIWEADAEFAFTFISPRVMEVLKLHPRHLVGSSLFKLGKHRPSGDNPFAAPPDGDLRSPFRDVMYEIADGDGEKRLCLLSGLPVFDDKTGAFKGYRGTARDVTAEIDAREQAARSQSRLSSAIESISEGFLLRDSQGQLVVFNSKFQEFFSAVAGRLQIGARFADVLQALKDAEIAAPRARPALDAWIAVQALAEPSPLAPFEMELVGDRWIKISESLTMRRGVVVIVNDITESKQREGALLRAKLMAEEANRFKGEFLANMSHELRTPLNAIIGFSEIMRAETFGKLGNDRYLEYSKDILDSSRHLLGIINDILDISKADAGKLQLYEEEVDLRQEITDAMRLFTEHANDVGLKLKTDLPDEPPPLWADQRKIKQILLNLLSNAIKFTPPGGEVRVKVAVDDEGEGATGDLLLLVSDSGIGIDSKDIEKVFSAFGQVESSLSRRYEGTGLGLPLSVALVELHGGKLELESAVGVGTKITVRLPKRRMHHPESSGDAEA
ncbi:MAG TPA: PAS domain-containing sensor histidine kinase [Alphaproteobacteria bacterium]|jgi:signal transduction histidine kinase